jgi:hypothetical protein
LPLRFGIWLAAKAPAYPSAIQRLEDLAMPPLIAIIVYSCLASAPLDDFNPHIVGAVQAYVARHPDICSADPPLLLERDTSFEECQSQGLLHILPEWQKDHPDRVYLGAPCFVHWPEPLELHALKEETSAGDQ